MGKSTDNVVLDAALDHIVDNCTKMTICENEPPTYTEANLAKGSGGKALADQTLSSSDFTKADGDVSGRKVTVAQKANITVDVSGTADHRALLDVTNSKLLQVTTVTSQALVAANTVTVPAHDIEIQDPT